MRLLLLLVLLVTVTLPASACDVNLFAIIAGTTKQDAFSGAITHLAESVKALGDKFTDEKDAQQQLVKFMSRWVEFSNSFNQFPPEWARQDPLWKEKFSDLGVIIGEIRRQLIADKVAAHDAMLKFSRRLSWLYEYMPKSERAQLLLQFTRCFDGLWAALPEQSLAELKIHAADLVSKCKILETMVEKDEKYLAANLASFAEQLRVISTQINAFKTKTLRMTLSAAEGEFITLNEKLSAAMKPADSKNANPTDH